MHPPAQFFSSFCIQLKTKLHSTSSLRSHLSYPFTILHLISVLESHVVTGGVEGFVRGVEGFIGGFEGFIGGFEGLLGVLKVYWGF